MSIWGRRDSEPPAEEARESQAEAQDTQEPAVERQDGEPAPAFWRAQGETPASLGGNSDDALPPDYEHVPPAVTEVQEPTVAVAHEPVMAETQEPVMAETQEPVMAETREPVMAEAQEPVVAEAQEPVVTEAQEPAPAVAAITPQRWSEILVAFVDDPRGSVKMAADAVDEAIDEFVNSVRARQRQLASTWQGAETDTEQLRSALREYRKLEQRVRQLDLGERTVA